MPRDSSVYLDDILTACIRIGTYTAGMDFSTFRTDNKTADAVLRNLETKVRKLLRPEAE